MIRLSIDPNGIVIITLSFSLTSHSVFSLSFNNSEQDACLREVALDISLCLFEMRTGDQVVGNGSCLMGLEKEREREMWGVTVCQKGLSLKNPDGI